jgi:uncharacterized protein YcsI (UPF0317 family)
VSMRPIPADLVGAVVRLSARMPAVHGAPVHVGDPQSLLVGALDHPRLRRTGGVRRRRRARLLGLRRHPQAAVMASTVPFALTHAPGHMLITDVPDRAYRL